MQSEISNPDQKPDGKVFQTAAWMWLAYIVCLVGVDGFIYANQFTPPVLWYHVINAVPALVFVGMAYLKERSRQKITIPKELLILLITMVPILVNHLFDLHLPPAPLSNLEGMILRQLPVLSIGLVLVAWHYRLETILVYSLGMNVFELAVVLGFGLLEPMHLSAFYFIILIRTVCFMVVGVYISQLITRLRLQQDSLRSANHQLAHYASMLESLTISRERNRMSRELHDTVVHTLSGLSVQLETIAAYWDVNPETARNLLGQSLQATRSGLQETRRAIKSLRASPLEDLGLIKALHNISATAAQRGAFAIEVELPEQDPLLSPDVEQCLYRTAQEALENVVRHANARHVRLSLQIPTGNLELIIQDDGAGFDLNSALLPGHGGTRIPFGISGMKERAALVGGDLSITSRPGAGTIVCLRIPIRAIKDNNHENHDLR